MRYSEWFKRTGDATPSQRAVDVGRKLLGYLSIRRQTPGVQTLVERVTLDDGTVVEAAFYGDHPRVIIHTPDGGEACELYVESGLLDLGPNIAPDAAQRFNRGPPEFDDRPATLYFGDGVQCVEGEPGLNGKVRIDSRSLSSQCLPNQGNGIESRLTDPVKKQAQAMLPASCWSGLMQRYVHAVYGGDALDYSATTTALTIAGVAIDASRNIGLISVGGRLNFVSYDPTSGSVSVHPCVPSNGCFSACLALWRSMPDDDDHDSALKNKVLSIALSGCKIGTSVRSFPTGIAGHTHFTKRPAMHFSADGRSSAVVVESGGVSRAYRLDFNVNSQGLLSVSTSLLASGDVINCASDVWELLVSDDPSPFGSGGARRSGLEGANEIDLGASYDFPVYARFDGSDIRIVRYSLIVSSNVVNDIDGCEHFSDTSPLPKQLTGKSCSSNISSVPVVASGYYCTSGSGVLWSSVEQSRLLNMNIEGGTKVYTRRDAWSKSIKLDPIGDETEESTPLADWSFAPSTLAAIFGNDSNPAQDYDCLQSFNGFSGATVYARTTTRGHDGCSPTSYEVVGDCIGPSSGTGFPGAYAEANCDFRYATGNDPSSSITNYARSQQAIGTAFYFDGIAYVPTPHALSICAGSYEFVADRYSLSMGSGIYADKQVSYNAGVSGRISADFSADIYLVTASNPGETLCTSDIVDFTFIDSFSGTYNTGWSSRREYYHRDFSDFIRGADINAASRHMRGVEVMRSWASYSGQLEVNGSISFNTDTNMPDDYSAAGGDIVISVCPYVENLFIQSLSENPITSVTATSNGELKKWSDDGIGAVSESVLNGFSYACAERLLGARVTQTLQLDRGASIHMDRHEITGGYTKVNTPSFVGWA